MPAAAANQSVARALRVLCALAESRDGLGVRELARTLAVSPSIAQRLVSTLADFGFAEQEPSRRYRVGVRAFAVGNAYLSAHALASAGLAELRQLAEEHRLNGYLGVLRGQDVVYLITSQSSGPIAIRSAPGERTHLHSTALGKAILAQMGDVAAEQLLGSAPYARLTPRTRTRFAQLRPDLQAARRLGYALSDEENLTGVFAIGAPVRDAAGATVAAISGALPRHEVTRTGLPKLCRLVRQAAERISARLGAPTNA